MSESSQLAQMAERLRQNADAKRMRTEKAARDESEKPQNVIEKDAESVENFYKNDTKNPHPRHWILERLSKLQFLLVFAIGCALTAWLYLSGSYGIYSKSSGKLPVQTYTVPNMGSGWAICQGSPVQIQSGKIMCKVSE